jgi:drug/metabolite transporter (DMT)-like permease
MSKTLNSTVVLAIIACLLWASAFTGVKIGLQYSSPLQFAGIRFFLSGLIILPFAKINFLGFLRSVKESLKLVVVVSLLQTFLQYALFYKGIELVPGALAAIIIGATPVFTAIIAHFTMPDDKMSIKKTSIILLGLSGVVLVSLSRGNIVYGKGLELIGILLLILCNINSGFINVFIARDKSKISPLVLSSSSMIVGGIMLFALSVPMEGFRFQIFPAEYYWALAWLSLLSAIAISIWMVLLKRDNIKVSDLNLWKFIIPVFGAMLSWRVLPNESPDVLSVSGMIITGASLILLNLLNRKKI